jgi:hypothetical protein
MTPSFHQQVHQFASPPHALGYRCGIRFRETPKEITKKSKEVTLGPTSFAWKYALAVLVEECLGFPALKIASTISLEVF